MTQSTHDIYLRLGDGALPLPAHPTMMIAELYEATASMLPDKHLLTWQGKNIEKNDIRTLADLGIGSEAILDHRQGSLSPLVVRYSGVICQYCGRHCPNGDSCYADDEYSDSDYDGEHTGAVTIPPQQFVWNPNLGSYVPKNNQSQINEDVRLPEKVARRPKRRRRRNLNVKQEMVKEMMETLEITRASATKLYATTRRETAQNRPKPMDNYKKLWHVKQSRRQQRDIKYDVRETMIP